MIRTEAFHIAPLVHTDASSLHQLMEGNKDRFARFFPKTLEANVSLSASQIFIANASEAAKNRTQFLFAIKVEHEVVGLVYIKEIDWTLKEGEFAYCIDAAYAGKGWISRSVQLLSHHAFEDLHLTTLKIISHQSNRSSIRVAEKSGFQFIKTLEKGFTPPGEKPQDMDLYECYA